MKKTNYRLYKVHRKNVVFAAVNLFILSVFGLSLFINGQNAQVQALSGSEFKAGNIIADSVFFDGGRMNATDVQNFLNVKVPVCDTWGTQWHSSGRTRAAHGAANGNPAPYTCLKDYRQDTPSMGAETGLCSTYSGGTNRTAAQIIADVSVACGVSPQSLLVLLQKEQSLVTDDWPWQVQYTKATGFGCPDTAACDPQYGGFFYQVYYGARQFKKYGRDSSQYGYKANRNNYVQYNPNAACGGSNIYIENQSTAGLYNYTPYQPNGAALNNLYGSGDSCSAYGNRNFWRIFTDWFGPTNAGGFLLRTVDNATVYLVAGDNKYPIADANLLGALPFGNVYFASSTYLDGKVTQPNLGRVIKGTDGTVYYYDSHIKLPFGSCAQVLDYGYSCGQIATLTDYQITSFANGPGMTSVYATTSGKKFHITAGQKREIFDDQSLSEASIANAFNVLSEPAINNLVIGNPVIRKNVVVTTRSSGQKYLYTNNTYYKLSSTEASYSYIQSLPTGVLDDSSIPSNQINNNLNGFVTDATTGIEYLLMPQGKALVTDIASWGASTSTFDTALISSIPSTADPINNGLVMTPGNGTVYFVTGGKKRPVPGWGNLLGLNVQPFTINRIDADAINAIPTGAFVYAPGRLVKTANSGTVYIVKNYSELMPISSFLFPQELGSPVSLDTMSSADFGAYTVANAVQTQISCGGQNYVGINGSLYVLSASDLTRLGMLQASFVEAGLLCDAVPKSGVAVPSFLLDSTGTIYLVQSGVKRAFTGYGAYLANGGTSQNTLRVSNYFTGLIPNGSPISQ